MVMGKNKNIVENIKRIINENSCVAFAEKYGVVYWAHNKDFNDQNEKEVRDTIKGIFSSKHHQAIHCDGNRSFTTFDPDVYDYDSNLRPLENIVYDRLNRRMWQNVQFRYISDKGLWFGNKGRAFSCAEKRIVGYLDPYKQFGGVIIVSKRPCYYCIPVSRRFAYLDSSEFVSLHVLNVDNKQSLVRLSPVEYY